MTAMTLNGPIGPVGHQGPAGPPGYILGPRKWVYHPYIRTFFWDRDHYKLIAGYKGLDHDKDLAAWCKEYNCKLHRSWVECPDDETVLLFGIRW
jgi:hypothetical protein